MKKDRGAGSILIVAEIIALVVVIVCGAVKYVKGPEEPKQTYTARKPDTEEKEVDVSYRITCNNGNQRTLINP